MDLHLFFFNDTATTEIYTLSLHDALPIYLSDLSSFGGLGDLFSSIFGRRGTPAPRRPDRKSTRLNSSHDQISYAVFCLKKKSVRRAISWWTRSLSACAPSQSSLPALPVTI